MESNSEFTPREYQIDLYEKAIAGNTIIYLPTGSGKTYVTIMVIKHMSQSIRIPWENGGKRTVFLVNTVPLVAQQCAYVQRHTDLTCHGYSGDMSLESFDHAGWTEEFKKYQVLVMTCQILLDLLNHGCLPLSRINLMILDECHHAVGDHPMRLLMKRFENYDEADHPKILGTSATLLNSNVKAEDALSIVRQLEISLHSKVVTVDSMVPVKGYGKPAEEFVLFEPLPETPFIAELSEIIDKAIIILAKVQPETHSRSNESSLIFQSRSKNQKIKCILEDIREHIKLQGLYFSSMAIKAHMVQIDKVKKSVEDSQAMTILHFITTQLTTMLKMIEDQMTGCNEIQKISRFSSDQLLKLFAAIHKIYNETSSDSKFCCIIFVRRRYTAKVLYHVLCTLISYNLDFKFLKPQYIVGNSADSLRSPSEAMALAKWNANALVKFRTGEANCLIATDVLDEGVDVPSCSVVIRYDLPQDFRAYVQSKGRARYKNSKYVLFNSQKDTAYFAKYSTFRQVEKSLQCHLIGQTDERFEPIPEELKSSLYIEEIKPYIVVDHLGVKSVITEVSAISLINRYCTTLGKSKFGKCLPTYILHKTDDKNGYMVSIQLPMSSPYREIIYGDVAASSEVAKRSAAMKACILLHEIGEFTDRLLPKSGEDIIQTITSQLENWREENHINPCIIGTTVNKRSHDIAYPDALCAAFPQPGRRSFLHIIRTTPVVNRENSLLQEMMKNSSNFAIVTKKPLPQLPKFPIFMTIGEVNVEIKSNHAQICLSDNDLKELKDFHWLIFSKNILQLLQDFMVFDADHSPYSFLIVPVDEQLEINWNVVRKSTIGAFITLESGEFSNSSLSSRKLIFSSNRQAYIATLESGKFAEQLSKQPILVGKKIPQEMNLLAPSGGADKFNYAYEDPSVFFTPDSCRCVDFPALYYFKAFTLPSILYRVTQLLLAHDLCHEIAVETSLGSGNGPVSNLQQLWQSNLRLETPRDTEKTRIHSIFSRSSSSEQQNPKEFEKLASTSVAKSVYDVIEKMSSARETALAINSQERAYSIKPKVPVPNLKVLTEHLNSSGPSISEILPVFATKFVNDGFNLKRIKTLGESFLSFITSVYLFETYPSNSERYLTSYKDKIVSNRHLFYCGTSKNLAELLKGTEFMPQVNFIIPAYSVPRELQKPMKEHDVSIELLKMIKIPVSEQRSGCLTVATIEQMSRMLVQKTEKTSTKLEHFIGSQSLPDKAVSDAVEILTAVYLNSFGFIGAAKLLQWLRVLSKGVDYMSVLSGRSFSAAIGNEEKMSCHMPWAGFIEKTLDYTFKDRSFLLQAFTHQTYTPNTVTMSYDRLEFVGNAVIDFLVTAYICENCGHLSAAMLVDLRFALLSDTTLACLSVKYGLHTALMAYAPKLSESIEHFVQHQQERGHVVDDELLWILFEEDQCNIAENADVPKALSDIFKSVIGAIYLDSGKNLCLIWDIIYSLMYNEINRFSQNVPKQPVNLINQISEINPKFLDSELIKETSTFMIPLEIEFFGNKQIFHGFGRTKKHAKAAAAKQALKFLRNVIN